MRVTELEVGMLKRQDEQLLLVSTSSFLPLVAMHLLLVMNSTGVDRFPDAFRRGSCEETGRDPPGA